MGDNWYLISPGQHEQKVILTTKNHEDLEWTQQRMTQTIVCHFKIWKIQSMKDKQTLYIIIVSFSTFFPTIFYGPFPKQVVSTEIYDGARPQAGPLGRAGHGRGDGLMGRCRRFFCYNGQLIWFWSGKQLHGKLEHQPWIPFVIRWFSY